MATARTLAWIDGLAWTLVYGGLFALVLGIATGGAHLVAGWSLGTVGGVAVAAGIVLIVVRSRLRETPPGTPPSNDTTRGQT